MLKVILHYKRPILFFFLIIFLCTNVNKNICTPKDHDLVSKIDSSLQELVSIQQKIKDIHPFLEDLSPIAIYEKDSLFILI